MSRAFVKEDALAAEAPIPRPAREHPNYVTPAGMADWQRRAGALSARLVAEAGGAEGDLSRAAEQETLQRELRALESLIESAIVVPPPAGPTDEVRFGAWISITEAHGGTRRVRIVGADEVCIQRGEVSWVSPLGRALLGRRAGDSTVWERPGGNVELELLAVSYDP